MLDPDPLHVELDERSTRMIHSRTREGSTMTLAFAAGLIVGAILGFGLDRVVSRITDAR